MAILILFAFVSGMVTIFAPCIWPILPIVLSVGASGGERKPLGLVVGLSVSFMLITLALASLVRVIPFDPDALRLLAVVVIGFLGLTLIIPALGARLESLVSRLGGLGGRFTSNTGSGFGNGFVTGFALGVVWSPCAGPILATVATLAATQSVSISVVLITFAFVVGVAVPLFVLALLGQKVLTKTRVLSPYSSSIQRVFGVVMILAAVAIYTGYDRKLQTQLLDMFPSYGNFLSGLEKNDTIKQKLNELKNIDPGNSLLESGDSALGTKSGLKVYGQAPEFSGIEHWLNTDIALTMKDLRGKVVLVDFWTYSCINCIRTLPHVTSWYEKYKDQGFVVVGVHTPEFAFEKKTSNVEDALKQYGINYPVAQDNNYVTWRAYNNRYWPAHYLIDVDGNIREYHFGEGNYEETEQAIRSLLEEAGRSVATYTPTSVATEIPGRDQTPETYLGSARMERFGSPEKVTGEIQVFTAPETLRRDYFAYTGTWRVDSEKALAVSDAGLTLHFRGKKVFLVLAPSDNTIQGIAKVFLDGVLITDESAGSDVKDGQVIVDKDRLYELFDGKGVSGEHTLRIEFESSGTAAYAFTFS